MRNSQQKLMEAIADLVPGDLKTELSHSIEEWASNVVAEIDAEYEAKFEEAQAAHDADLQAVKQKVLESYADAHQMLHELAQQKEDIKAEAKRVISEGFEEAFQMLKAQERNSEASELELYEEFDGRTGRIREFYVDKLNDYLNEKIPQIEEMVAHKVAASPAVSESTRVVERVLEAVSPMIANGHRFAKADNTARQLAEAQARVRILESKNMKLGTEVKKLNEVARRSEELIRENVEAERRARREVARNAQSQGQRVVEDKVITETTNRPHTEANGRRQGRKGEMTLLETWRHLSGVDDSEN